MSLTTSLPTVDQLLKGQIVDQFGNLHFVIDGQLIASFFKNTKLEITFYPEAEGLHSFELKSDDASVSIVYLRPIDLEGQNINTWMGSNFFATPFGHCAVNGQIFYAHALILNKVSFPAAHISEYDEGDERHELAKQLLLHLTGEAWNPDFMKDQLQRQQEEANDLIRRLLSL